MKGIQYVVDDRGEPRAVMIDLVTYGDLWEDIQDVLVMRSRRKEPRESLAEVKKRLRRARRIK